MVLVELWNFLPIASVLIAVLEHHSLNFATMHTEDRPHSSKYRLAMVCVVSSYACLLHFDEAWS